MRIPGSVTATCRPIRKPARRRRPSCASTRSGFAQGGPIKENKAFFFFNYEEQRSPSSSTLQRVILTPAAASGIFSYGTGGAQQQNLLQIAAANGQLATLDPTVAKILGQIQAGTAQTGGVSALNNPLVQQYTWSMPTESFNPSPTMRLDYEVTRSHRLTGSFNYRHINSTPDTTNSAQLPFPNSLQTGSQQSTRWTTSESLRSTVGDTLFNEFRIGGSGGATLFSPEFATDMFSDTNGYRLNFNGACCGTGAALTNWSLGAGQSSREASTKVIENTTTWLKGNHNLQFGAVMVQARCVAGEPDAGADRELRPRRRRGGRRRSSTPPRCRAHRPPTSRRRKHLYAMLTGRHRPTLTGDARINAGGDAYNLLGASRAEGRMREFNFFVSDSWRMRPEPDGQRRPALRPAEPVLPDQRQLHHADGRLALRGLGRRQHRQARHADRRAAAVRPLPGRPVRLQRRSQQPGAEHRRGVAGAAVGLAS